MVFEYAWLAANQSYEKNMLSIRFCAWSPLLAIIHDEHSRPALKMLSIIGR
jgi:hypothetical protein